MRRHYVYYRVRADDAAAAISAVQTVHALRGAVELLCRTPVEGALLTLMEVYAADDAAAAAAVERDAALALAPWLVGERHVEVFDVLPER